MCFTGIPVSELLTVNSILLGIPFRSIPVQRSIPKDFEVETGRKGSCSGMTMQDVHADVGPELAKRIRQASRKREYPYLLARLPAVRTWLG
jgi:hypothetical protein